MHPTQIFEKLTHVYSYMDLCTICVKYIVLFLLPLLWHTSQYRLK